MFSGADAYDRFMGRYSTLLAPQMADLACVAPGQRVLDVGCGPGALTRELVARLGANAVCAVDPSEPFVAAVRTRYAGVDARVASAESLPYPDDAFDATLAQLVVHFMTDPVAGIREMARVTRPGGVVVASVWDHVEAGPLTAFWTVVRELDSDARDESDLPGVRKGHLAQLFAAAGLGEIAERAIHARLPVDAFEAWWAPFELGVGPAGTYLARQDPTHRATIRERCRRMLPAAPFVHDTRAWAVRGVVQRPGSS